MTVDMTSVMPGFPEKGVVEAATLGIKNYEMEKEGAVYEEEPFHVQGWVQETVSFRQIWRVNRHRMSSRFTDAFVLLV